jgi:purine-nucleoside phosphorylase
MRDDRDTDRHGSNGPGDYDQVRQAGTALRARLPDMPETAVILGSGLGGFAGRLSAPVTIPYADLPHWPVPGVPGHEGHLVAGTVRGRPVAALAGRSHAYEGYDPSRVVFGVRALRLAGVKTIVLTNAAGGIRETFSAGALMVIDDHINLTGQNPLVGPNDDRFGPRFPDMSEVYSRRLRDLADLAGRETGVSLVHGVYAGMLGPSYETPAEIRSLRAIGADAVGMSTVHEALAARHVGLEVLGLSCISNMAAGLLPTPLSHEEVLAATSRVADQFIALLEAVIARL